MHPCPGSSTCPRGLVCHCLKVTESALSEAMAAMNLRTIPDIQRFTGAGDGCMACHRVLRRYLEKQSLAILPGEAIGAT